MKELTSEKPFTGQLAIKQKLVAQRRTGQK